MGGINNLRLPPDDVGVVVDLFVLFSAMGDHNILALLNIGDIYNDVIVYMTLLVLLLLRSLVTLVVLLIVTMRTIMISMAEVMTTRVGSTIDERSREEDNEELHFQLDLREDFPPCTTKELK